MLNKHISTTIKKSFSFELTEHQEFFFDRIGCYITENAEDKIFLLKGYAGTGKTTSIGALVKALKTQKIRTVLLAPTGRAAKVFGEYAKTSAWTIHKYIYRQESESDGMGSFSLNYNKSRDTLFIVDEASMLADEENYTSPFGTGNLLGDLLQFVFNNKNNKLLLVGDSAQLPPIGLNISHALNGEYIQKHYGFEVEEVVFKEVIRQSVDSDILLNATNLRVKLANKESANLRLQTGSKDVRSIMGGELIEELTDAYASFGLEETLVITRSNKRANAYNEGIRRTILYKETEIASGDYLMIVKNNYFWKDEEEKLDFIANGEIAEVLTLRKIEVLYGFRFADVDLRLVNYDMELNVKILLDTLTANTPALSYEQNKELYNAVAADYPNIKNRKRLLKKVRENTYFNALQVKFAYAITCHKSQGGQWDCVFVDQGYLTDEMVDADYYRWLYTAITRAKKRLYFVNFQDRYIEES